MIEIGVMESGKNKKQCFFFLEITFYGSAFRWNHQNFEIMKMIAYKNVPYRENIREIECEYNKYSIQLVFM